MYDDLVQHLGLFSRFLDISYRKKILLSENERSYVRPSTVPAIQPGHRFSSFSSTPGLRQHHGRRAYLLVPKREVWHVHPLGTLLARQRRGIVAHHAARWLEHQ